MINETALRSDSDLGLPLFALGCIAVQGAFDFVGGWGLMPVRRPSALGFLRVWLRGVTVHSAVLAVAGAVALAVIASWMASDKDS